MRAAGVPCARDGANAMYGGGGEFSLSLSASAGAGISHAGGRPCELRQVLSARRAATTGGRRRPRAGRTLGARRNGTRCSGEKCGRKLSQTSRTLIRLFCVIMPEGGNNRHGAISGGTIPAWKSGPI